MTTTSRLPLVQIVIIGTIAGLFAGLFGVGGGFVMVPLFVLWLGMHQKHAHATSLLSVAFISIAALAGYLHLNQVDLSSSGFITLGAIGGIFTGVRLLEKFSERTISLIFASVLILASVRLLISAEPHQLVHGTVGQILLVVIGFSAGALSGLLGIGGGIVIVPALIICSGISPEVARGTSLVVIVVTALIGATLHHRLGNLDHKIAVYSGVAGVPAAALGTYLSSRISNGVLVPIFCLLLITMAGQLVVRARGQ